MPLIVAAGREYQWPDPTSITFREAKTIKDRLGVSIMEVLMGLQQGQINEDTLLSMFMVAKLRTDGDADLDSLMDLSFTDLAIKDDPEPVPDGEPVTPLEPAESGPRKSAAKKKSSAGS